MKKSRIFMAAGAFTLVIASVFATKANKKFVNAPQSLYWGTSQTPITGISTCRPNSLLTLSTSTGKTFYISKGAGGLEPISGSVSGGTISIVYLTF